MNGKPTLFIKPGCPWCREAMAFFSEHGVELDVRDVTNSKANMDRMIAISDQSMTPTFEFGDFIVADFSVDEFLDELHQNPEVASQLGLKDDDEFCASVMRVKSV